MLSTGSMKSSQYNEWQHKGRMLLILKLLYHCQETAGRIEIPNWLRSRFLKDVPIKWSFTTKQKLVIHASISIRKRTHWIKCIQESNFFLVKCKIQSHSQKLSRESNYCEWPCTPLTLAGLTRLWGWARGRSVSWVTQLTCDWSKDIIHASDWSIARIKDSDWSMLTTTTAFLRVPMIWILG